MTVRIIHADMLEALPQLLAEGVQFDAVVTDPPYHLTSIVKRFSASTDDKESFAATNPTNAYKSLSKGFMGKQWDGGDIAFRPETWAAVLAVMKPGAHLIAFSGTRTYHRMACAIEDAGFEIRDQLGWLYGSGFPKSHDISKGIDKTAGAVGVSSDGASGKGAESVNALGSGLNVGFAERPKYSAETDEARQWQGWGTALKPAWEPMVLARKPFKGTVAANVLANGCGGLNIDACRVAAADGYTENAVTQGINTAQTSYAPAVVRRTFEPAPLGRWPANVIHDGSDEVLAAFPQTADSKPGGTRGASQIWGGAHGEQQRNGHNDSGSAARFFYSAKADAGDRLGSKHPTVKPVDLMAYLLRLVTPAGGRVLDPFAGSGTTGMAALREGFDAVLIEREDEYVADIRRRVAHVSGEDSPLFAGAAA